MTSIEQHRGWNSWKHLRTASAAMALAVVLVPAVIVAQAAQAPTYTVLYAFSAGTDAAQPFAGMVRDKAGNLYGTTASGGAFGYGTVFKVDTSGHETVLHSFSGVDGAVPLAGLAVDKAGNLYGTTAYGGASFIINTNAGDGTVFKVDTSGNEAVLHSFTNTPDGAQPVASLVIDKRGNLYGTTVGGGADSFGTVFEVDRAGTEIVLHSFSGADGGFPEAGLVVDKAGNLYGTTASGGSANAGTVFKVDISGTETVLHNFADVPDGAFPNADLVQDEAGNLYGTTAFGGAYGDGSSASEGIVFEVYTNGTEIVLHSFSGLDGGFPEAGLVRDKAGNLYGTTTFGGASFNLNGSAGDGTVFEVDATGTEIVLHSFSGVDGQSPLAGLVRDKAGNLYGTTAFGGSSGNGIVFKLIRDCDRNMESHRCDGHSEQ